MHQTLDISNSSHASQPRSSPLRLCINPSSCIPPSPMHTTPYPPIPPYSPPTLSCLTPPTPHVLSHISPTSSLPSTHVPKPQTCDASLIVHHRKMCYEALHPFIELLGGLAADILQLMKNRSLSCKFHSNTREEDPEHRSIEEMRRQYSQIRKLINTSQNFIAYMEENSSHSETAFLCQREVFSISLDAEACLTLITSFLAQEEHVFSPAPRVSYVS